MTSDNSCIVFWLSDTCSSGLSHEGTDSKATLGSSERGGACFQTSVRMLYRSSGGAGASITWICLVRGGCFHRPTRGGSMLKKAEQKAQYNSAAMVQKRQPLSKVPPNTLGMGILHIRTL